MHSEALIALVTMAQARANDYGTPMAIFCENDALVVRPLLGVREDRMGAALEVCHPL